MNRWTLTNVDTGDIEVLQIGSELSDPKGWDEVVLTHDRDPKWHGVFKGFDQELGFYCKGGGKEFVDAAYEEKGQEARMLLHLETQCNGTWTTVINGKANYSTYRQEYVSNVLYTFITFENDDITSLLKNREDTSVDLLATESLNGTALNAYGYLGYDLTLHGKLIRLQSAWENEGQRTHLVCREFPTGGVFLVAVTPDIQEVTSEITQTIQYVDQSGVTSQGFGLDVPPFISPRIDLNGAPYIFPMSVVVDYNFSGTYFDIPTEIPDIAESCGSGAAKAVSRDTGIVGSAVFLRMWIGEDPNNPRVMRELGNIPFYLATNTHTDIFSFSGTLNETLFENEKIWMAWVFQYDITIGVGDAAVITWKWIYDTALFSVTVDSIIEDTTGKAIAIHEGWSRLCEIITDQPLAFKSEFFGRIGSQGISYPDNGYGAFTAILSGKAIRGFENDLRIETNLKDMFESCWSVWGIGLGVENLNGVWVVRAEEITHFYSNTVLLTLDFVPKIQMRHVQDLVYNEVELGYRKWETEKTNGLDEPNSSVVWSSQFIKSNKNRFTAISPYVAGMYPIELTRREGVTTKDTRYDEDMFFIALNTTTVLKVPALLTRAEKDENIAVGTGLISPETAYNLRLMPNLAYQRLANQFTAGWVKMSPNTVKLAETEGNIGVLYSYSPTTDNITFPGLVYPGGYNGSAQSNVQDKPYIDSTMGARGLPLWEPEEYTFEYPLPFTDYLSFLDNPYGLIRFSDTDTDHLEGWVMKLEYNLKIKSANFTILRKYGT